MYSHIWKKYLPFINIHLKRSANGDQVLALNRGDFERAGTGRKAGYKFTIELSEGRVSNVISGSQLAVNLAGVMLENEATKQILKKGHYSVSLNTKFQLLTKNLDPAKAVPVESESSEEKSETTSTAE
ncbi:MAG: hypothetical protein ABIR81_01545 [Ginsengibacter sp.]